MSDEELDIRLHASAVEYYKAVAKQANVSVGTAIAVILAVTAVNNGALKNEDDDGDHQEDS